MTTRGMKENEFYTIGKIIAKALRNYNDIAIMEQLRKEVRDLTEKFPLRIEGYNE